MVKKQKKRVWIAAAVITAAACIAGVYGVTTARNREYIAYRTLYQETYKSMAELYIVLRNNGEQVLLEFENSQKEGRTLWFKEEEAISTQELYDQRWQETQTWVQQLARAPCKEKEIYQEYYNRLNRSYQNMQEMERLLRAPGEDKKVFRGKWEDLAHAIDTEFEFIYQGFPIRQKQLGSDTFLKLAAYWSANVLEIN